MNRQRLIALIFTAASLLFAAAATQAQPGSRPVKYAVLSLIGNKLNLVTAQMPTGSHLDRNIQQSVPLTQAPFDGTALATIQALLPPDTFSLYLSSSTALLAPDSLFDGKKLALPQALSDGMKADGATHLLLLTRFRQPTQLRFTDSKAGYGQLEGMGFYIDRQQGVKDEDSREVSRGFLAPYAYLRLSLIELSTGAVLAERNISASTTVGTVNLKNSVNPWDALSAEEKIELLNTLLARELTVTLPLMLAPR